MTPCNYHDLPLVCGVADCRDDPIEEPAHWTIEECVEVMRDLGRPHFCRDGFHHVRQPVHLLVGGSFQGMAKVPCPA